MLTISIFSLDQEARTLKALIVLDKCQTHEACLFLLIGNEFLRRSLLKYQNKNLVKQSNDLRNER